jgi:hypothetical protein
VVFVFTVVPAICNDGLPAYIRHALEQALFTQPDCDVILVSNFAECATVRASVADVPKLLLVDSTLIASQRTADYRNLSRNLFMTDGAGELWMTSALRFFIMEDLMQHYNYTELIHVEADNMVYGRYTSLLPVLRGQYDGLAATPLNVYKSFITASVMWISSYHHLYVFNNFLLELGNNHNGIWDNYLTWLRPHACCKPGGFAPDKDGYGVKRFAVNEMSMLGYYHNIEPTLFKVFPIVPAHTYLLNRHVINMSTFGPEGSDVGPPTGHGIWDPNSWGQFIGKLRPKALVLAFLFLLLLFFSRHLPKLILYVYSSYFHSYTYTYIYRRYGHQERSRQEVHGRLARRGPGHPHEWLRHRDDLRQPDRKPLRRYASTF